jgi:hypothetical protein
MTVVDRGVTDVAQWATNGSWPACSRAAGKAVFSLPESAFVELLCSTVVFYFYLIIIIQTLTN